jgi:hypothetical protein
LGWFLNWDGKSFLLKDGDGLRICLLLRLSLYNMSETEDAVEAPLGVTATFTLATRIFLPEAISAKIIHRRSCVVLSTTLAGDAVNIVLSMSSFFLQHLNPEEKTVIGVLVFPVERANIRVVMNSKKTLIGFVQRRVDFVI